MSSFHYDIDPLLSKDIDVTFTPDTQIKLYCYHVTTSARHPFLQVMLSRHRDKYREREELDLPEVDPIDYSFFRSSNALEMFAETIVRKRLQLLSCKNISLSFRGLLYDRGILYMVVDATGTDIANLYLTPADPTLFASISEIVNNRHVCKTPIQENVTDFLLECRDFLVLRDSESNIIETPEVVYTGHQNTKKAQFENVFGKPKEVTEFGFLYCFSDQYPEAARAVNRLALFIGSPTYTLEAGQLLDESMDSAIVSGPDKSTLVVAVNDYDRQFPLSFHSV